MRHRARRTGTSEGGFDGEAGSGPASAIREWPVPLIFKGIVSVVFIVAACVLMAPSLDRFLTLFGAPAVAAQPSSPALSVPADRTSCHEIGASDLRSPREGLWFQDNCVPVSDGPLAGTTPCNRRAIDGAEFTEVAPHLYVFRQSWASVGYLWYGAEACFDLVSGQIVTAVCADLTVSFKWDPDVCSAHGGVLTWVNGP